ncbi:unnamed protein product [Timema podura]|uniref:Phenylalanine--tRNA ligase beta subunit B1 domain-containing protein n=1 Tax=Timema podura TaxID=61482 RepID=A0ABN7NSI1_TIMPD|nr:unnamed protein product [Timema podura]
MNGVYILFHSFRSLQTSPSTMDLQSAPLASMSFYAWSIHLVRGLPMGFLPFSLLSDEEFNDLCFEFGLELDEVIFDCERAVLVPLVLSLYTPKNPPQRFWETCQAGPTLGSFLSPYLYARHSENSTAESSYIQGTRKSRLKCLREVGRAEEPTSGHWNVKV